MTILEFLILLVISGICGSVAQSLVGFTRGGCLVSIVVGFIGSYLGLWFARRFDLPTFFVLEVGGVNFPVIWSVIGGLVFAGLLGLLFPSRGTYL